MRRVARERVYRCVGVARFSRSSDEIARLRVELGERKAQAKTLEDQLGVREATLVGSEQACAEREAALTTRERYLIGQRDELESHRSRAVDFERNQNAREQALTAREAALQARAQEHDK